MKPPGGYIRWKSAAAGVLAAVVPKAWRKRQGHQRRLIQSTLSVTAGNLHKVSAQLESAFLATGKSLEDLDQKGQEFLRSSSNLVALATGQAEGKECIIQGTKVVESPLAFLDQCLAESEQLHTRLREDRAAIDQLRTAEDSLRETMAPLKYMQTLFKIESAPLGAEAQVMFTALTEEIERQHHQVCELFDTKFRELAQVQAILSQVIGKLENQIAALRSFVTQEKKQIEESLRQLRSELADNQKRNAQIQTMSGGIAGAIQEVIMGLQFQDIVAQKLQHTSGAMKEILKHTEDNDEGLHFLHQSCRVEAEQLKTVQMDLAGAEKTVKTAIQNILNQLSAVDANCISLSEFKRVTTSADGIVQALLDLIAAVRKQVEDMAGRTVEIHEHLKPIQNMASGLTVTVRDLSQRIHLIGLNAQVQASQFSHGAGLEVLSARTSEISNQTNGISETIAHHLDHVAAGLTASVSAFDELHEQSDFQINGLANEGAETERSLHALRDQALSTLLTVGELLDQIRCQAQDSLTSINYVETADATLTDFVEQLQALSKAAEVDLRQPRDRHSSRLEAARRKYTMASERDVFDLVVQSSNQQPPATTAQSLTGTTAVEMFETAASNAAAASAKEPPRPVVAFPLPTARSLAEAVPTGIPPLATSVPAVAESNRALGDNVELF